MLYYKSIAKQINSQGVYGPVLVAFLYYLYRATNWDYVLYNDTVKAYKLLYASIHKTNVIFIW